MDITPVNVQNSPLYRQDFGPDGDILVSNAYDSPTDLVFDDTVSEKPDPMALFSAWLAAAKETEINDANAMALATVDQSGLPDLRMVLLNGWDKRGFVFFTNTQSAKGEELSQHPKAALLFHWKSLRRQVRVRGGVTPVNPDEADSYFASRARRSQIGAHASQQSRPLSSRTDLVDAADRLETEFEGQDVPRPAHWSGFRINPVQIEFWQDGEFRLHDRVVFRRDDPGGPWTSQRLYP